MGFLLLRSLALKHRRRFLVLLNRLLNLLGPGSTEAGVSFPAASSCKGGCTWLRDVWGAFLTSLPARGPFRQTFRGTPSAALTLWPSKKNFIPYVPDGKCVSRQ